MNKYLAVFALTMFIMGSVAAVSTPKVFADWLIDGSGALVRVDGTVLGDDDRGEVENEDENEDDSDNREDSGIRATEQAREAEKQRLEKSRETLKNQIEARMKIQEKTGQESEFELRSEDGRLKLKQEVRNAAGTVISKRELEMKEGEALHIQSEDGETARINAVRDGEVEIIKNRLRAKSNLELKVGEKNEISVTLPNGKTREISIPDVALSKLIENGVISQVDGSEAQYELIAGADGEPVYETEALVEKKIFGLPFLKLKFANKVQVAAGESDDGTVAVGDIVSSETQETNFFRRFLERLTR